MLQWLISIIFIRIKVNINKILFSHWSNISKNHIKIPFEINTNLIISIVLINQLAWDHINQVPHNRYHTVGDPTWSQIGHALLSLPFKSNRFNTSSFATANHLAFPIQYIISSSDYKMNNQLQDEPSDSKKTSRWAADPTKSKRPLQSTNESCDHEVSISSTSPKVAQLSSKAAVAVEDCGRKRLKEHRVEMAGRVWIPDIWGQEDFLKDWVDCNPFDASLVNNNILSARQALIQGQTSS